MGLVIAGVVVGLLLWLFWPNKKADVFEVIGVSIYKVLIRKNPKTTDDEARAYVFEIMGEKEYKKFTLIQLKSIQAKIEKYLALHDLEMNQYEMRRIVECERIIDE